MDQRHYEIVKACIAHGCPAISHVLLSEFDNTIRGNNAWKQHQAQVEQKKAEAEQAKALAATDSKPTQK